MKLRFGTGEQNVTKNTTVREKQQNVTNKTTVRKKNYKAGDRSARKADSRLKSY